MKKNMNRKTYIKPLCRICVPFDKEFNLMNGSIRENKTSNDEEFRNNAKEFSGVGFSDLWLLDDEFSTGEEEEEDQYATILRYNTLMK